MTIAMPSAEELSARFEKLVADRDVVGASLAVLADGEIHEAAAGLINHNTGVEATTDAIFQIGSISKVWAATVVEQLVEEGALELDAPVLQYLPELQLGDKDWAGKVTIGMLLNHTSGIGGDWFDDTGRGDDCLERYVAGLDQLDFGYEPGTRFSYCNSGWTILGRVIEVMTGEAWDAALRQRVIEPLGLTHCVVLPEDAIFHRAAVGHLRLPGSDAPQVLPVWALPRSLGPAGATLTMTARDLVAFARLHLDDGVAPDGTQVLGAEHVDALQQQTVDLSDQSFFPGLTGWGHGWMLFDWGGTRLIGHDGGTAGQVATLRVAPDLGMVVVVLANTVPGGALLFRDVNEWLWGEVAGLSVPPALAPLPEPERPAADVERYVGRYERPGVTIEVTTGDDGGLLIDRIPGPQLAAFSPKLPAQPLIAHHGDTFLTGMPGIDAWSEVNFLTDGAGDADPVTFVFDGGRLAARA